MQFETWLAFTIASATLLAIPGPTVLLVISYAIGQGKTSGINTGWATVPGVTLGDFIAMSISLLGAGAILAASSTLFTILKLAGSAYLIWLGFKMWRSSENNGAATDQAERMSLLKMFWNACIVTALNPKSIIFFVAFLPLFLNPDAGLFLQFAIMEITFLTMAAINVALWAMFAGQMRGRFTRPDMIKRLNRIGGAILIGAGVLSVVVRRH